MRIVSADTMRSAEQAAINSYGIPGQVLMETAGRACADAIHDAFGRVIGKKAIIVAGKGNNGGDGYVIARYLSGSGWKVAVCVVARKEEVSGDAAINLKLLDPHIVQFCPDADSLKSCSALFLDSDVLVDALFGIGLKKNIGGVHAEAVRMLNEAGRPVVAVDIPSGVEATTGAVLGAAVQADITVTFGFGKLGHVLYPGRAMTGRLVVADIGLPDAAVAPADIHEFLDPAAASSLVRQRDRKGHKGNYGHCLIVAGSTGKTGAAALAANSAVRTGSGLVTLAVPESLNAVLETKTTEAMTLPFADAGRGFLGISNGDGILAAFKGMDAVAIGPGISRQPETVTLVRRLVAECPLPLVVDADGLNAIAEDVSILDVRKSPAIVLTPHPGEMSRLCGFAIDRIEADRVGVSRDFAVRHGVYLVLKGAGTVIATPDGEICINGSGNPGMATGGMGDVLTGVIVSLLGQGYSCKDACSLGVFLHGYAADMVAERQGEVGMMASDVQESLPLAYKRLLSAIGNNGR